MMNHEKGTRESFSIFCGQLLKMCLFILEKVLDTTDLSGKENLLSLQINISLLPIGMSGHKSDNET